jgi:hypothetical protein
VRRTRRGTGVPDIYGPCYAPPVNRPSRSLEAEERQAALLLRRATQSAHPNDFADLIDVETRLVGLERRYEQTAAPFEWKFTRADLAKLLERLADKPDYQAAA